MSKFGAKETHKIIEREKVANLRRMMKGTKINAKNEISSSYLKQYEFLYQ